MDRDEFVAKHKHEFFGVMIDAMMVQRNGSELSVWIKLQMHHIEQKLESAYDDLADQFKKPPTRPPTTGGR
jgi:hypothetical protein